MPMGAALSVLLSSRAGCAEPQLGVLRDPHQDPSSWRVQPLEMVSEVIADDASTRWVGTQGLGADHCACVDRRSMFYGH
jgi:hypothetical protein